MRIQAGALRRFPPVAAPDTKTAVSELGKGNVLENQREVSVAKVIVFLTHASLRLTRRRKPINLALFYRVIVRIVYLAWYLAVRIQEV